MPSWPAAGEHWESLSVFHILVLFFCLSMSQSIPPLNVAVNCLSFPRLSSPRLEVSFTRPAAGIRDSMSLKHYFYCCIMESLFLGDFITCLAPPQLC